MTVTIGMDLETSAKPDMFPWSNNSHVVAVGVAREDGSTQTWVLNHNECPDVDQAQALKEIREEVAKADRLVFHRASFDVPWLTYLGEDTTDKKIYCTKIAEYLIHGQKTIDYSLDGVSKRHGIVNKIDQVKMFWDSGYETKEIPLNILLPYLEQDCINTLAIFQRQVPMIHKWKNLGKLVGLQCNTTRIVGEITTNGMHVDVEVAEQISQDLREELAVMDSRLEVLFGQTVNLSSTDEMSCILYGGTLKATELYDHTFKNGNVTKRKRIVKHNIKGLGFTPIKGTELAKAGFWSASRDIIKRLKATTPAQKEVKELLLERSSKQKAMASIAGKGGEKAKGLINKVQPDGCLHTEYTQWVTRTGRFSSRNPNLQNLPRSGTSTIKFMITPRNPGWVIMDADLSQLEWRVAAYLSQDPVMMKEIMAGVDAHLDNAINNFGDKKYRQDAKIFTFRMIYGGSAYSFYADNKMPNFSLGKWNNIVKNFYTKYTGLKDWHDSIISDVNRDGYLLLPTGRILTFDRDDKGEYKEQRIKNYPVQSMATGDIMPLAMCAIKSSIPAEFKTLMIAQVHDSIVFDGPQEEAPEIKNICISSFESLPKQIEKYWGFKFNVPLTGDFKTGDNYGAMKDS